MMDWHDHCIEAELESRSARRFDADDLAAQAGGRVFRIDRAIAHLQMARGLASQEDATLVVAMAEQAQEDRELIIGAELSGPEARALFDLIETVGTNAVKEALDATL